MEMIKIKASQIPLLLKIDLIKEFRLISPLGINGLSATNITDYPGKATITKHNLLKAMKEGRMRNRQ